LSRNNHCVLPICKISFCKTPGHLSAWVGSCTNTCDVAGN
jgi:hypothetical protein